MRLDRFLDSWNDLKTREAEVVRLEGILVSDGDGFYVSTEDIDSYRKRGVAINDSSLLPRLKMGISGFGGSSYCDVSAVVVSGKVIESSQGLELSSVSYLKCLPHRDKANYEQDFYPMFPQLPNRDSFFCQVTEAIDMEDASLIGVLTFKRRSGVLSYKAGSSRLESVVIECEKLDSLLCAHISPQEAWPTWTLPALLKGSFRSTRKGKCLAMLKSLESITVLDSRIGMSVALKPHI
ncbi:MAG: hypothetical protein P1V97_34095 [Planctomycetota bacterium]|nr:hypothetical protein [Planctomycetota bacterium]